MISLFLRQNCNIMKVICKQIKICLFFYKYLLVFFMFIKCMHRTNGHTLKINGKHILLHLQNLRSMNTVFQGFCAKGPVVSFYFILAETSFRLPDNTSMVLKPQRLLWIKTNIHIISPFYCGELREYFSCRF